LSGFTEEPATLDVIAEIERRLPPVSLWGNRFADLSLSEVMDRLDVPGLSVAVVNDGRLDWARGYGQRDAENHDPVETSTLFQAASISKPVAALAALRMAEQGHLDLDEDLNAYLTSWRIPANDDWQPRITLRHLLSHSGGLTVHGFTGYRRSQLQPTILQILDGQRPANSAPIRVDALPGTQFRYSGGGYTVLQQLLEDVSGEPFANLVRSLVLDPAGMDQSRYAQPLPDDLHPLAASGHRSGGEVIGGKWHVYPELAAAGLWTTPTDLCRLAITLQKTLAGESSAILSPAMMRQMLQPPADEHMGLGFFIVGDGAHARFGHTGGNEGFRCELVAYQQGGFAAAVMSNSDSGTAVVGAVLQAIASAYGWPGYVRSPQPQPSPSQDVMEQLTGDYELRPGFNLTVKRATTGLTLSVQGQPPLNLIPVDDGTWTAHEVEMALRFDVQPGQSPVLVLQQNGADLRAPRI